ncbi:MAG: hypothetical protein HY606_08420 [Planctomycetes bacterium]|nr:hypothetical protein [Planctomycetota bacterium]
MPKIKFDEIETKVSEIPGIYEIYTNSGIPLKVGIGKNIKERLLQHRSSRQSALKLKPGGCFDNPNDVKSKKSILAKHLYYDESITDDFDLKSESGRRAFLASVCCIDFKYTGTKADARQLETIRQREVSWRYIGKVEKR